jgi:hypothetical protein
MWVQVIKSHWNACVDLKINYFMGFLAGKIMFYD